MAHRFYDSTRWRNLRDMVIARHPLCEQCKSKGLTTIATQVDHILPIEEGGNPTDWTNLQPLCASCHSKKTRKENEPEKKIEQKITIPVTTFRRDSCTGMVGPSTVSCRFR